MVIAGDRYCAMSAIVVKLTVYRYAMNLFGSSNIEALVTFALTAVMFGITSLM